MIVVVGTTILYIWWILLVHIHATPRIIAAEHTPLYGTDGIRKYKMTVINQTAPLGSKQIPKKA